MVGCRRMLVVNGRRRWLAICEVVETALGNDRELVQLTEGGVGLARFDAADAGLVNAQFLADVFLAVALGEALDAHGFPNSHRDRWNAGDGPRAKLSGLLERRRTL